MKVKTLSYQNECWSEELPQWDSDDTLVFVFGAPGYEGNLKPFETLRAALPSALITGCSTSGEISGAEIHDNSLSVAIVKFEKTKVRLTSTAISEAKDSFAAGRRLIENLVNPDLKFVQILSDGLNVNGTELLKGVNSILPPNVIVTGGLAGDGDRFKKTWVIANHFPTSHQIAAVGFYGKNLIVGHGSKGGWDIFGPERVVTRSEGNILYELDHIPALDLYKEYLGEKAKDLPASGLFFPLSLNINGKSIVRTILSVDEQTNSLTFAGDIPQGCVTQLMRANLSRLIEGAQGAASLTSDINFRVGPTLAIAISCVGRRLILGQRAEEEVEATLEVLPKGTSQIGFYSYGEISPTVSSPICDLHNQTMTLTVLQEAA